MTQPPDERSDTELILAYRHGEDEALSVLIRRHLTGLYHFLYRMVQDGAIAEDLTQDAFVKLWKHQARFDLSKTFKTWLFTIGKNTALDYLRKKQPLRFITDEETGLDALDAIADTEPLATEILEQKEVVGYLEAALAELPPETRSIILMHENEDMTFEEIAEAMGKPMNTVKSRYRRALANLHHLLKSRMLP